MKANKKKVLGALTVLGVGVAITSALIIYKLAKDDYFDNKSKAKDARKYLIEKYGEDALAGKKIVLVNEDKPVTKTRIAKDILQYGIQ